MSTLIPLDKRLILPLNRMLSEKAAKSYSASRIRLLLRVGLPILTTEDFQNYRDQISVPDRHPFEGVPPASLHEIDLRLC